TYPAIIGIKQHYCLSAEVGNVKDWIGWHILIGNSVKCRLGYCILPSKPLSMPNLSTSESMKNEWRQVKTSYPDKPVYKLEQNTSLKYWKERYMWLLERYNAVLEQMAVRKKNSR